jgi:hypothetical protein
MEDHQLIEQEEKRPTFLLVLCILSFVSIGFGFLGNLSGLFSGPLPSDELEKIMASSLKMVTALQDSGNTDVSNLLEKAIRTQEYINLNFYQHTIITLLSLLVGFIGVFLMFNKSKKGFHYYILYNILSILLVYVSVPVSEVPTFMVMTNLFICALFVYLYSRNLFWMK